MPSATPGLLRTMNVQAILHALHERGPLSRAALARVLQISQPTVTQIVDALLGADCLVTVAEAVPSGGRPAATVGLNPLYAEVLVVDVGGSRVKAGRFDFCGRLTAQEVVPTAIPGTASQVSELIHGLASKTARARCVVLGAPGFVQDGVVVEAANIPDWRDLSLADALTGALPGHYIVDNDVNLATLGESRYGAGRGVSHLVFVTLGTGLGAGLIIDNRLVRGASGAAGEIGFLVPDRALLETSGGLGGVLESRASTTGLQRLWAERYPDQPLDAAAIVARARRGSADTQAIVREWARLLASAFIALSAVANPQRLVVGGGGSAAFDLLQPEIQPLLNRHVPFPPDLVVSELGDQAALYGGLELGLSWLLHAIPEQEAAVAHRRWEAREEGAARAKF